ncbi:hypothetical protein L1887_39382 [Cichorium endivia]|nr:hypothetical protein L1887_39382 [Cichorium endivia]
MLEMTFYGRYPCQPIKHDFLSLVSDLDQFNVSCTLRISFTFTLIRFGPIQRIRFERSGANGDDGGWTEVNRRRRGVRPANLQGRTTTFFVTNIPEGVNALELKLICKNIYSGFSSLTDVYIAKKKDVNGHNFAFVRYKDVSNVNEIIESLNMVRCRDKVLIANVARFQRQSAESYRHPPPPTAHGKFQQYPNPRSAFVSRFRDGRSFADVVSGMPNGETTALRVPTDAKPSAIISLTRNQEAITWLDHGSLIGENSNEAKTFLQNNATWLNWFKRLDLAKNFDLRFERIIWLKIVGVPSHAWNDSNFEVIANNYGSIIANDNSIDTCQDLSYGKIGVLSAIRTKINEEITVCIDGSNHRIRVMEIDEDWSPFCNSSDYSSDSSDDENIGLNSDTDGEEDDEGGVSDTWVHNDVTYEEGKIKEDNDSPGDHSTTPVDNQSNDDALSGFVQSLANEDRMQVNCADEPNGPDDNPIPQFPTFCPIEPDDPSVNKSNDGGDIVPLTDVSASSLFTPSKRRKLDTRNSRFNPYRRPSSLVDRNNEQRSSSPSIDLNRVFPHPPSQSQSNHADCVGPDANESSVSISSFSKEIEHTVRIGNQLGFGIDEGNEVFKEVISGGLLSIWDSNLFTKTDSIKSRFFLACIGRVRGFDDDFVFIFFGDFNCVRRANERMNSIFCPYSAAAFNKFIGEASLLEHNMGGRKFTHAWENGAKLSKLDRFLVCHKFMNLFPASSVTALNRHLSDHSPIILCSEKIDYGPPPFRFFNSWLLSPGIDGVVSKAWISRVCGSTPDIIFANKLKSVKDALKRWRRLTHEQENNELIDAKNCIRDLDSLAEVRGLSEDEGKIWKDNRNKILELENMKKLDLKQKSRLKWLVDGDENSRFFHGIINNNVRKNAIHGFMINGAWVTGAMALKLEAFNFFSNKFRDPWPSRPQLLCSNLSMLSLEDGLLLEAPFSLDEIKGAVWDCGNEKAPGPDGFTFKFLKNYWDLICPDVLDMVKYFEKTSSIARGCNSSFITLVPKVKDPTILSDYRPISLIGSIYKIITKILSTRIKRVIGKIIGVEQSAYIENRNILDGPLIINELYTWAKKSKKKMFLFKVDFDKAFDSVNWGYLDSIMQQMAMEGLNSVMKSAGEMNIFHGISVSRDKPRISHLLYADDAIFAGDWSRSNLKNLTRILKCFHMVSGLKVNFHKSKVFGVSLSNSELLSTARILGCDIGSFPFTYLGVPVGANMSLKKNWKPVIDKFQSKLSCWKAKTLSFGGRLTLIKSKFPVGGGNGKRVINWVAWKSVIASKDMGGLGIGSLRAMNLSLLSKWIWRLKVCESSSWGNTITQIHNLHRKPLSKLFTKSLSGVWLRIAEIEKDFSEMGLSLEKIISCQVESGDKVLFWKDSWCSPLTFERQFPDLYKLERRKTCFVSERITPNGVCWRWKNSPSNPCEIDQFNRLIQAVNSISLSFRSDSWVCTVAPEKLFHVAAVRCAIDSILSSGLSHGIHWIKSAPLKVCCFIWRAQLGRIPTAASLHARGLSNSPLLCQMCNAEVESSNHLLVSCPFAKEVFYWVFKWCRCQCHVVDSITGLLNYAAMWGNCVKKKNLILCIVYCTFWLIWKARNDRIFNKVSITPPRLADNIMACSFQWFNHRSRKGVCNWNSWCRDPFECL